MDSGLTSLYKILKDENRQQIIKLLGERKNVSYTELLEASETGSTGLLNYHLKILGDLINKDETGQYILSEKGKIALSVLLNFPTEINLAQKRKAQKIFWSILALGQIIILMSLIIFYLFGIVDFSRLTEGIISFVMGIFLAFFGYKMIVTAPTPGSDEMKARMRKAYPLGGAWLGFMIAFFGVGIILGLFARPLLRYFWSELYFIFMVVIAPALGAVWGYWVGKRNGFDKPKWMTWVDEKTGFA